MRASQLQRYRFMSVQALSAEKPTYPQILKSTVVVGGSSLATIAVGIVRSKATAVLLGPEGVGLTSLYQSIADLAQSLANFGVQGSGVRQIAESVGTGDSTRIAWTATVLRHVSVILGVVGAVLLAMLAQPVSYLTFGSGHQATAIALLGIAVFLRTVSAGQTSLLQGMRRISDLARVNVLSAVLGTAATLPLIYALGLQGVVLSIIAAAALTLVASWFYTRRVKFEAPPLRLSQMGPETARLLKLGFAFLASGLFTLGTAYAIRIIVLQHSGVEATGLYQAAWTLGGLYVGVILQAMGADFYPRLTAVATDDAQCNRLVNEQAQIGMLLAGPGVVATLTFAPSGDGRVLLGRVSGGRHPAALDLPRHDAAHRGLAVGIHRLGERRSEDLLLARSGGGAGSRGACFASRAILRSQWCRHGVFCAVRGALSLGVRNRAPIERISVVHRQSEARTSLCLFRTARIRLSGVVAVLGRHRRRLRHDDHHRPILVALPAGPLPARPRTGMGPPVAGGIALRFTPRL